MSVGSQAFTQKCQLWGFQGNLSQSGPTAQHFIESAEVIYSTPCREKETSRLFKARELLSLEARMLAKMGG